MIHLNQVLEDIAHYDNVPMLPNILTNDDIQAILENVVEYDYGSCSVCLIGVDYVFYLTQCPAKYFHSQVCHKYPNDVLQITPVGSYTFKENWFNVYIAPKVQIINDWNYDLQGEIGEDNRQFILKWQNTDRQHNNISKFTDEVISLLDDLSPTKVKISRDYEFFNFAWQNNQLVAVDTVFYKQL